MPFFAAAIGAAVGSLATARVQIAARSERLETTELVILDKRHRPAARLKSDSSGTVLRFYAEGLNPAIALGVEGKPPVRFIRFFGEGGEQVAGIDSAPPDGHSTLALGDARAIRAILGAFPETDIPAKLPVTEWGLRFPKPHSNETLFGVIVKSDDPKRPTAGLRLLRPDGTTWDVY